MDLLMGKQYKVATSAAFLAPVMVSQYLMLASTTVGILLMMDAMECFLHTLRLHWYRNELKIGSSSKTSFTKERD